jgi:hypothetical protein
MTTPSAASSIIQRALAKVQENNPDQSNQNDVLHSPVAPNTLPSAIARRVIDAFAQATTPEEAAEACGSLKVALRDVLNWKNPKFSKSTKAVARSVGELFTAKNAKGDSLYCQAVEMVSFMSVIAPLLEPDRLARIADHAVTTRSAYGPTLYAIGPSGQLAKLLACYNEDRREKLLISLWDSIHDGRWWEHTSPLANNPNGRNKRQSQQKREEREAVAAQIRALINEHGECTIELLTKAVQTRTLSYSDPAAALMDRILPDTPRAHRFFVEALRASDDEDHRVLASHITALRANERPESPLSHMVALLLAVRGGPAEFDPTEMPPDPETWEELYPEASMDAFPLAPAVRALQGATLPGLAEVRITVLRNANLLKLNSEFMGNCTGSYHLRCQNAERVVFFSAYNGMEYNYAFSRVGHNYGVGEVNSRFNRGNVPPEFRLAVENLCANLNRAPVADRVPPLLRPAGVEGDED